MRKVVLFLMLVALLAGMYKVVEYFMPKKLGPAELSGALRTEEPADLELVIDKYFEKVAEKNPSSADQKCAHVFFGMDNQFAYVEMFCSHFILEGEKMRMDGGGSTPTRIALNETADAVVGFQQPRDRRSLGVDMLKIFPPEVSEIWSRKISSREKSDLIFAKIKRKIAPSEDPAETGGEQLPPPSPEEDSN